MHLPYASLFADFPARSTWRDLEWIRSEIPLPLVLKGILTREDATIALEHGADAVWVSNHGGRQLDGVAAGLDALPEVARRWAGSARSTSTAASAAAGTCSRRSRSERAGCSRPAPSRARSPSTASRACSDVLSLLRDELALGLGLLGCTTPDQVTRAHVEPALPYDSPA